MTGGGVAMAVEGRYYRCRVCGNLVYVVHPGEGALVCCGQDMELVEPKTGDPSEEKHVPYVEEVAEGYVVKVGKEVEHPMNDDHRIVFVELKVDGVSHFKFFSAGEPPKVLFKVEKGKEVEAREYCNLHGLWKG